MLLLVRGYNAEKNLCLTAPIWPVKHDKDMEPWEDMNDKSKPALSLVTPQARHQYTRFDQVDQLVGASETDPEMGFMTRLLALCNLPRTNPGDRLQYKRVNGPYKLVMIAGADNKLPYGTIPRLLLAWVCTEAVRTQSRELILGSSLSEFMRKLDISCLSGCFSRPQHVAISQHHSRCPERPESVDRELEAVPHRGRVMFEKRPLDSSDDCAETRTHPGRCEAVGY